MTKVRIAGIVESTVVDGPGLRTSIYMQGCTHKCKGCHNPETWDDAGGVEMDVVEVAEIASSGGTGRVTISGGDPFHQPEALLELVKELRKQGVSDIWVYTGYYLTDPEVQENEILQQVLKYVDCVVDGPFIELQVSPEERWKGSHNQHVIQLGSLGKSRENQ